MHSRNDVERQTIGYLARTCRVTIGNYEEVNRHLAVSSSQALVNSVFWRVDFLLLDIDVRLSCLMLTRKCDSTRVPER